MALKASGWAGTSKLHDLTAGGVACDLCGQEVDSEVADAVALDCSFAQCDPESSCYHTHCLEKFLKGIRLEKNRKIGFPCPRGCGKATKFKEACRGKILKSHPVTIRSEANKKRRQAELEQLSQQAVRDKAARKKEEEAKAAAAATASKPAGKGGKAAAEAGKGKAAAKPAVIKALNVANTAITNAAPPKTQAQLQKEQLAAAAKNLKNQILARSSSTGSAASSAAGSSKVVAAASGRVSAAGSASSKKEVKTLDEYLAERTGATSAGLERSSSVASSAAPQASAWGKSRASSASSLEAAELQEAAAAASPLSAAPAAPAAQPASQQPSPREAMPALASEEAFPPPAAAAGRPPRPPAAPAAAPAAPAAPAPAPAPAAAAVQPQGVWAQKQAVAVVPSAAPPPPPPRAAPAAAAASPAGGKGKPAVVVVPVQAASSSAADEKLSRAQRKNQKRAEKKAAAAAAAAEAAGAAPASGAGSPPAPDSGPSSPAAGARDAAPAPAAAPEPAAPAQMAAPPGFAASAGEPAGWGLAADDGVLPAPALGEGFERCMQALVQHKLQHQVEQLQQLGFGAGAAMAAVQQHGGNLEAALVVLLEQATGVQDSMHGLGLAASAAPAEVDLTEELQYMQELQARYGLPPGTVEMLAVEHQGDLDSLAASLAAQQAAMLSYGPADAQQAQQQQQTQAAAAAAAAAAAGAQQAREAAAAAHPEGQLPLAHMELPGLSGGGPGGLGGLFGTLGGASEGLSARGPGFDAFGFDFSAAALSAVHGGGQPAEGGSLFGTDGGMAAPHASAAIWGSGGGGGGAGAYDNTSTPHLLSLLGMSPEGAGSPAAGGFGTLGGSFDALQPSSTQALFEQRQPAAAAGPTGGFLPFPGSSSLQQQAMQLGGGGGGGPGSSGWQSGEGAGQLGGHGSGGGGIPHSQHGPFSGLPLWCAN